MDLPQIFVSPDGAEMEVTTPVVAVRMRARGWLPLDEAFPPERFARGGALPGGVHTVTPSSSERLISSDES